MTDSLVLATEPFNALNPLPLIIAGSVLLVVGAGLHIFDLLKESPMSGPLALGVACVLGGVAALGLGIDSNMNEREAPKAIPLFVKDDPEYRVIEAEVPSALEDYYEVTFLEGPSGSDDPEYLVENTSGTSMKCDLVLRGVATEDGQEGVLLCGGAEPDKAS